MLQLRTIGLVLAGTVLAYGVVRTTLVAYFASTNPETALFISPTDSLAAINRANRRLILTPSKGSSVAQAANSPPTKAHINALANAIPTDIDNAEVSALRGEMRAVLLANPLSARAMRIMGQLVGYEGQAEHGTKLLKFATTLSKHEHLAVLLMLSRSIDIKNWNAAADYADVIMRSRGDLVPAVAPLVVRMAETETAKPFVKNILAKNPDWRLPFSEIMRLHATDPGTPLEIYLGLREVGIHPTRGEIESYLNFLIEKELYQLAHSAWLLLLPPEQLALAGFVFNGTFDLPTRNTPFDWMLPTSRDAKVEIDFVPGENGNRALRVELGNRVEFGNVNQRLALQPGEYILSGRFRGEVSGQRGMRWIVACANRAPRPTDRLAETPMFVGSAMTWRGFELKFTIPQNCTTQLLRLTHDSRFASEQFAVGIIWYDDISIARVANGQ